MKPTSVEPAERLQQELCGAALAAQYREVRGLTEALCAPLATEDYVIQSMPDASPAKWHLAHTSWFFETFVLAHALADYRRFDSRYAYLFNSYYNALGDRLPRPNRGVLSRPTVEEIYRYRHFVDESLLQLLEKLDEQQMRQLAPWLLLGLNHEQQHQELLLTDIKHLFALNPLRPAYHKGKSNPVGAQVPFSWISHSAELRWIGHDGNGFAFDNEGPRHCVFLHSFRLASRLVTNGEYLAFVDDGGYERPELWLSDGWNTKNEQGWQAPLYWEKQDQQWWLYTLAGMRELNEAEPVCHVSYYEADAFARWSEARLPLEAEWETAAHGHEVKGNLAETGHLHPVRAGLESEGQMFGDVWEWTASPYVAYPGYRPSAGALSEYNGKFMCNQMVLKGGSCATPLSHIRPSYRNFFPPEARWQFTGVRLARDGWVEV